MSIASDLTSMTVLNRKYTRLGQNFCSQEQADTLQLFSHNNNSEMHSEDFQTSLHGELHDNHYVFTLSLVSQHISTAEARAKLYKAFY